MFIQKISSFFFRLAGLKQIAKDVGIQFTSKCPVYPNTVLSHALLDYVADSYTSQTEKQSHIAEILFQVSLENCLTTCCLCILCEEL